MLPDLMGRRVVDLGCGYGWITQGVIEQHRSLATYLNLVIRAGFALAHVEEWGPSATQVAAHPDWAKERDRPPFLLVAARR